MSGEKLEKKIARAILSGSLNATAWVFEAFIFAGILTIEAFLNPSYYADLPSVGFSSREKTAKRKKSNFTEIAIRQSIRRLQKNGFVEKKGGRYALTEKGKALADYILKRKKNLESKWDGKFRVVIFDIPEDQSKTRDWLRRELYMLNYKKLQKSVFIGKYPLTTDLIKDIRKMKIGNFVNYLLVEKAYKNIF
jgi:hypothetical protein